MSVEDIKAKGLKAWYVKDKNSGKYVSTKHDGNYDFVDEQWFIDWQDALNEISVK